MEGQDGTEPVNMVLHIGRIAGPPGGPNAVDIIDPGAAAQNPHGCGFGTLRVQLRADPVIILVVPVEAPLPDVASHIERAEGAGPGSVIIDRRGEFVLVLHSVYVDEIEFRQRIRREAPGHASAEPVLSLTKDSA